MSESTPRIRVSDIVGRPPGALKPWPNNPRAHSPKQIAVIKASIDRFGFTNAVLIDESDVILSGHGRVLAAIELRIASIPTRVITGFKPSEKRAYVIADNQIAALSKWAPDLLKAEMSLLIEDDFEIETTGFSTAAVDMMFDDGPPSDPDDLKEEDVPVQAVSVVGDHWGLDTHRLVCGDSLDSIVSASVLDGEPAQLIITDPPFNLPIEGHAGNSGKIKHHEFAMAAGEMTREEFTQFLSAAFRIMHDAAAAGAIAFVFMDWRHSPELLTAARSTFGDAKQLIVWCKENAGMGSFYRSQHELLHAFKKGSAPHINNFELGQHGRYRTNVWSYPGAATFKGHQLLALHPTVKPTAMIADAIRDCSHRKGIIFDPFAGSGTILLAAERTGRYARAIEIDPLYVDVAIKRWQRVSGKTAVLLSTGQTWAEVREHRLQVLAKEVRS